MSRETRNFLGLVGLACAACCIGPVIALVGAIAAASAVGAVFLGLGAIGAGAIAVVVVLAIRARRRTPPQHAVPMPDPVLQSRN